MKKLAIFTAMLLASMQAYGAEPLMTFVNKNGKEISGELNINALQSGAISFVGPDQETLLLKKTMQLGPSWTGEVEGWPGSSVTFTKHKGVVTGFIIYGDTILELVPSGKQHLVNIISAAKLPSEDLVLEPESMETSSLPPATALETTQVRQDILVYYTQNVLSYYGSTAAAESAILNTIAMANQGYVNSNVNILLNVVFIGPANYSDSGDGQLDLNRIRGTTDGFMDEVHQLRNQVGADLVHLVTGSAAGLCGIGERPGAFAVTVRSCFGGHTLAHEIGHNQGNSHNREDSTGAVAPYAYGFRRCNQTDGTGFRTVMSYSCSNAPRINYFSNPNITFNGFATGVDYAFDPLTAADNARSMNERAASVANYRVPPGEILPVNAPTGLTASSSWPDRVALRWVDQSQSEDGFRVERSTDGVNWVLAATLPANTITFTDTGRSPLTRYYYRVQTYNILYTSEYSNVATAVTTQTKGKGKNR